MTLTKRFHAIAPDKDLWQKFYTRHQQESLRRRLRAIKLLWEGNSRPEVCKILGCNYSSLREWLESYVSEMDETKLSPLIKKETLTPTYRALFNLMQKAPKNRQGFLTKEQESEFKETILTKKPEDMGLKKNIWTAGLMRQYIQNRFNVSYKPISIYDILRRLKLSHQKAHADYAEADPVKQKAFVEKQLKKKLKTQSPVKK